MRIQQLILTLLLLTSCYKLETTDTGKRFEKNDLRVINALTIKKEPRGIYTFSDSHSPMAFALNPDKKIGFAGPFLSLEDSSFWINEDVVSFSLIIDGKHVNDDIRIEQHSEAGMLVQEIYHEKLFLELRLFFHSKSVVVVDIQGQNLSSARTSVDFLWPGWRNPNVPALVSFPPSEKDTYQTRPSTQRINFLNYEHRRLTWKIEFDSKFNNRSIQINAPIAANAYNQNCARWQKRTRILGRMRAISLATQCLELLYNEQETTLIPLQKALEQNEETGRNFLEALTPAPSDLMEKLLASRSESEQYLRANPKEIPQVLAALLSS